MNYKAMIYFDDGPVTQYFPSMLDAAQWVDAQNNNHERLSTIEEIDANGYAVGGMIYTEVA